MGIYVGYVEHISTFYNFKPLAVMRGSRLYTLDDSEIAQILPESEKRNINLGIPWNDEEGQKKVESMFKENSLIVFEFNQEDLQPNLRSNGERNATGYKTSALDMIAEGKIRPIHTVGLYYPVYNTNLLSDFTGDPVVDINLPYIVPGTRVLVDRKDYWAGPYDTGYREYTSSYYIKPQIKENKYTISGYTRDSVIPMDFTATASRYGEHVLKWSLLFLKKDAEKTVADVITDDLLVESFRDSIQDGWLKNGCLDLSRITAFMEEYRRSELNGPFLTESIRKDRLNRLTTILTAQQDLSNTLDQITSSFCDLLVREQNNPSVEAWLESLLEKHPDLIERLKGTRVLTEKVSQMEQNLEDLQQKNAALDQEMADKKAEAEELRREALEGKKTELIHMDTEYQELSKRLEDLKKQLAIPEDINAQRERAREIRKNVKELEQHEKRVRETTQEMEDRFRNLMDHCRDQMSEMVFDGFLSHEMLLAASGWEAQEDTREQELLYWLISTLPTAEKSREELIGYLCRTIRSVRPAYSRNTIVNIAICITQGFLTVFAGEPGSGKTSICNLFGEVLGLNRIGEAIGGPWAESDTAIRYVPVSVERGWTSKRDLVGYYNPLSKTFDKSSRRMYNALRELDAEEKAGSHRIPFLILLDEANLSPMEYYWSDFMQICDNPGTKSVVNLGEDYLFHIPETLRFVATINNDHTTETLSPRLVDRAWIVSLPTLYNVPLTNRTIPEEEIEIISWESMCRAFLPPREGGNMPPAIHRIYDSIVAKFRERRIPVSFRVDAAIKKYWGAASRCFEPDETKTDPGIIALDYAVAQRLLPKISGSGEEFEKWLEELRALCSGQELNLCATRIKEILDRGNQQMKYFQFFS